MWITAILSALTGLFGVFKTGLSGLFETKQQALLMRYLEMKNRGATDVALAQIMAQVIIASENSPHFLVYAWRPIVALAFLAMILGPWFGYIPDIMMMKNVPELYLKYMDYMLIFMTGYAGVRTIEKVVDKFAPSNTKYLDSAMELLAQTKQPEVVYSEVDEEEKDVNPGVYK